MLRTAGDLKGVTIEAMDGDIGSVQDLYFDDHTWTVRYLVVDTGTWLPGRQVLISPFAFQVVPGASRLRTSLTKEQVKGSPSIDTDRPVDRQREIAFSQYYGYPYYWVGPYRWGDLAYPTLPIAVPQPGALEQELLAHQREDTDPHLRSARDVMGYYIHATDGDLGHVEDFLVDAETWAIRYCIVDTRNWLPGRAVGAHQIGQRFASWHEFRVITLAFSVFGSFLSFVLGGWAAARVTGTRRAETAMLHGAIAWLVTVPGLLFFTALGAGGNLGVWYGGLAAPPPWAPQATPMVEKATAALAARNAALGALTALLLGLVGSVVGGWMGSGERMSLNYANRP